MKSIILDKPIETKRLRLREFVDADWPPMLEAIGPEAKRFFDAAPVETDADAKKWISEVVASQHKNPRTWYAFAVELKDNRQLIGYCDLLIRQPVECWMAYSGYSYAPQFWRQGYGTETELAILDFGFKTLGLFRVSCIAEPENVGSWRIMEKCGMRREGYEILGNWSTKRSKRVDRLMYAILKEEWDERTTQQSGRDDAEDRAPHP